MNRMPFKLVRTVITGDEHGNAIEIIEAVLRAVPVRYYEYEDADGWEVGFECAPPDNLVELVKQALPNHNLSEVVIDHERCIVIVKLVRVKQQSSKQASSARPQHFEKNGGAEKRQEGAEDRKSKIDEVKKAL